MNTADVFERLEYRLIDAIPRAIAANGFNEPVCCMRVYYYDTHAPCTYLLLKPVSDAYRSKLLADAGKNALYYLWASGEAKGELQAVELSADYTDLETAGLLNNVYSLLCEDNDDSTMPKYRAVLQRVCRQLNCLSWDHVCQVTDDFVVVPADGSQYFADDSSDIVDSIPADRLELLRSRGLLGPGRAWDRRPGYSYGEEEQAKQERTLEAINDHANAMPVPDRIKFWIGILDLMAAGKDNEITRIGMNARVPLEYLAKIGNNVVAPLLKFACLWADEPEWDSDDEDAANKKPMADVIQYSLWKVKEMGYADRQVELLLREFLDRSCRVNEGRKLWGTLPVHCADCLHALFSRYPESEMEGNNALGNRAAFLRIPLP
jgi:hypothetical protein